MVEFTTESTEAAFGLSLIEWADPMSVLTGLRAMGSRNLKRQ